MKLSSSELVCNFMRLEVDVQHIPRKKYWQTPKLSILFLIYCDRVLSLKEMHITELAQKNSS